MTAACAPPTTSPTWRACSTSARSRTRRKPARGKDGVLPEPTSFPSREALRKLRTNLRYIDVDNPPRSIVVTSSGPRRGQVHRRREPARVMARAGQPTLLVDADLQAAR